MTIKTAGMRQCSNVMEAVGFAKAIGVPLVAHLTIHWSLTDIDDDPEGKLFAKLREGLHKWLHRRGIAFAAIWARERQCRGQSDVEHSHLLFHLPVDAGISDMISKGAPLETESVERRSMIDHRSVTRAPVAERVGPLPPANTGRESYDLSKSPTGNIRS